jgi:hypothetical protein
METRCSAGHRIEEFYLGPVDPLLGGEGLRLRTRRQFGCRIPAGALNRWCTIGTVGDLTGLPEERCMQIPALVLGHLFKLPLQHLAEVIGEGAAERTLDRRIGGRLGFHAGHQAGLGNRGEPHDEMIPREDLGWQVSTIASSSHTLSYPNQLWRPRLTIPGL